MWNDHNQRAGAVAASHKPHERAVGRLLVPSGNRDMGRVNRTSSRVVTEYHAVRYGQEATLCGLPIAGMSIAPGAASKCEACYRMVQADLNAIAVKQQVN